MQKSNANRIGIIILINFYLLFIGQFFGTFLQPTVLLPNTWRIFQIVCQRKLAIQLNPLLVVYIPARSQSMFIKALIKPLVFVLTQKIFLFIYLEDHLKI
jgi:hypothetical protein